MRGGGRGGGYKQSFSVQRHADLMEICMEGLYAIRTFHSRSIFILELLSFSNGFCISFSNGFNIENMGEKIINLYHSNIDIN